MTINHGICHIMQHCPLWQSIKNKKNAVLESSEQSIRSFFFSELHKYTCDRSSSATIKYTYLCSLFDKHRKGARVRIMWTNIMIRYMVIESHSDTIKQNFICSLFSFVLDSCLLFSLGLLFFFSYQQIGRAHV